MNRPWMPMYWRDYLCDTGHLTLEQHGAYLLLICHYWTHGKLPENDETMARILRVNRKHLPGIWLAIAPFFDENRRHKRIDAELEKHRTISEKRAYAGRLGGLVSHARDNNERFMLRNMNGANAKQTGGIPQSHIDSSTSSEAETTEPKRVAEKGKPKVTSSLAETVRAKGWTQ